MTILRSRMFLALLRLESFERSDYFLADYLEAAANFLVGEERRIEELSSLWVLRFQDPPSSLTAKSAMPSWFMSVRIRSILPSLSVS